MNKVYPFSLLDDCHVEFDPLQKWEVLEVEARSLLNYNRFDLFANLLYIRSKAQWGSIDFGKDVYRVRTAAITGYKNSEPGNNDKSSFNDFVNVFDKLIETFKYGSFDSSKSLVPIDSNGVIVDGAHRVSCAAWFGKTVTVCKLTQQFGKQLTVPYSYFDPDLLGQDNLDAMAIEYCRWHNDIHMVFIWPKGYYSSYKEAGDHYLDENTRVVYRKKLKLSYRGIRNLILQIYYHMPWMGTIDDGFKWSYKKTDEVYDGDGEMEVVLVEVPEGLDQMTKIKNELRKIFRMGLVSVHSTDSYDETWLAANLLFNENSLHHLGRGYPDKFARSFVMLMDYRSKLITAGCNLDDYLVDSSMVMALYGIREAGDLDFLKASNALDPFVDDTDRLIESNEKNMGYHDKSINELLYDPHNYFIFMGMKVLSLSNLVALKLNRGRKKDLRDVSLIEPFLNKDDSWKKLIEKWKLQFRILKTNAKRMAIKYAVDFLHFTRLYIPVRSLYRFLRRR